MLGAPLGGTTRGGQYGLESNALSLITPPNGSGGGGICFPSIVVVALGDPNSPVTCCAATGVTANSAMSAKLPSMTRFIVPLPLFSKSRRTACDVTSVISPGLLDFSLRGRTSAGAQKKLDEGYGADEHDALSFEAEQRARALWVHEVDLRELDPVRKTLAANGVLEHGDVRTGYGSGYPQNV